MVKMHILPALGDYSLSQVTPHLIQSFHNALLRDGKDDSQKRP
ncbi:tyrosine-type recombinase/integrase [Dysosmobacter sp.]